MVELVKRRAGEMGKLKNEKHEKFAQAMVKSGGDRRVSYRKAYGSGVKDNAINKGAYILLKREEVRERVLEILQSHEKTQLRSVVKGLADDLDAKKEVLGKDNEVIELKDNGMRASAQDKILKLYGLLGSNGGVEVGDVDNRSVNIVVNAENLGRFEEICEVFRGINAEMGLDDGEQSGEIEEVESYE